MDSEILEGSDAPEPDHIEPELEPDESEPEPEPAPTSKRERRAPTWASAIPPKPSDDQLETFATLGFNALRVSLERVLIEVGIKPEKRIGLIVQLTAQMNGAVAKRRLWEAEQVIKNEGAGMLRTNAGPKLEPRSDVDATGQSGDQQAGRPAPRRGRPRTR